VDVEITEHDFADPSDPVFAEWYDAYVSAYDRPYDFPWLAVEKRVNLTNDSYGRKLALAAWRDGGVVGGAALTFPLRDNTSLVYLDVFVPAVHRRTGVGTALMDRASSIARDAGRTRLFAEGMWGVDEQTSASTEFLSAMRFQVDLVDAVRQLDLPGNVPDAPVAAGYTLRSWRNECPEECLDDYADLRRRLISEAPNGEVGLEEEYWDAERVRAEEADLRRSRRQVQVVVAVDGSGALAGHTQLVFSGDSDNAYQWDTLVLPEHRGHGLGLTLKSEAMRAAADLLAGRRRIITYNAASNAPMIAVNEALGYRQVAWCGEFIRDVQP